MTDQVLLTEVLRLKGMLASIIAQNAAAAAGATAAPVDFIVDLFDRGDSDGLGGHWGDTSDFVVRNNRAIASSSFQSGQPGSSQVSANVPVGSALPGFGGTVNTVGYSAHDPTTGNVTALESFLLFTTNPQNIPPTTTSRISVPYSSPLASPDMTLQVRFDGPSTARFFDQFFGGITTDHWVTIFMVTAGAFFGSSNTASASKIAAVLQGLNVPALNLPLAPTPSKQSMDSFFGDLGTVFTQTSFAEDLSIPPLVVGPGFIANSAPGNVTGANNSSTQLVASILTQGSNTLLFSASGNSYSVSVNGSLLFSGTSSLVSGRKFAGLCAIALNLLGAAIKFGGGFAGITSFKAWRNDQPEPPNESGHGLFVDGVRSYSDKYHTPQVSGGVITGYTYNPNA